MRLEIYIEANIFAPYLSENCGKQSISNLK